MGTPNKRKKDKWIGILHFGCHHGGNTEGEVFTWQESNYAQMQWAICFLFPQIRPPSIPSFPKRGKNVHLCLSISNAHGLQCSISLVYFDFFQAVAWLLCSLLRGAARKMRAVTKPYQKRSLSVGRKKKKKETRRSHVRARRYSCLCRHNLVGGKGTT